MGKGNSKLKKKDRSQSVLWSFRFPSLAGKKGRAMAPPTQVQPAVTLPHLDTALWLERLDLAQYSQVFHQFSGVEMLLYHSEAEIRELGVKNSAHRARIVSSLVALREKYEKGGRKGPKAALRHSVAVEPNRIVSPANESDLLIVNSVLQSKSLCNIRMAGGGEESAGTLRKALERELSLDPRDLRSHAWYHGPIPRPRAEEVLANNGDFLVRDCLSQPGDYVLTCRAQGQPLHFLINKVVTQRDTVYQRVQFQFEDEPFETVADLITYYVGSGKPVSSASQARVKSPCNRAFPLSFYAAKYAAGPNPPRLPVKKQRSLSVAPCEDRSCSADGLITRSGGVVGSKFSTHSLPRPAVAAGRLATVPRRGMVRGTSDSALSPTLAAHHPHSTPPPKPSLTRCTSKERASCELGGSYLEESETGHYSQGGRYQGSGSSDSGNGSGDSAQSSAAGDDGSAVPCTILTQRAPGVVLQPPRFRDAGYEEAEEAPPPLLHLPSRLNVEEFSSLLLPATENKPLDEAVLRDVKARLLETGPRVLANHLTRVDMELTLGCDPVALSDPDLGVCVPSGLELVTLPFGSQLRRDLIERNESLKMLIAVTILTCVTESERAEILNKWIQVALETKTALGNLFGFNAIIMALCMPQISRLSATWHILRQKFTDSAFNFESKLRSTVKSMNDCKNPQAPNTSIPHILPYLVLQERSSQEIFECGDKSMHSVEGTCFSSWDSSPPNFGLSTMHGHLSGGRDFAANVAAFRRSAEIVLGDSKTDDLLLDLFRTELHMKLLWGSRGAGADAAERYSKLHRVLQVLSENAEPPSTAHHFPPDSTAFQQGYNRCIGTSV